MTTINRQSISRYQQAKAELNSLMKETAQVGAGFLAMLLLTGGQPPAYTVALSVVGGVAFVAWSEHRRLNKSNRSLPATASESLFQDQLKQVIEAEQENFSELVKTAGIDPSEDFAGASLVGVRGVGCYLRGFNFGGADLSKADLSRADLRDANLSHANMRNAKLSRADLSGADLRNARLMDSDFSYADMRDAILEGADLIEANLKGANVGNARFGNNRGLSEEEKVELVRRGAIFPPNELVATSAVI